MKTTTPQDSRNEALDEQIAAALHGELSAEERARFESRLNNDPAAQAAFQEAKAMHDLLEKTHRNAQPDAAFEQRMVSGVRRKLQQEQHRETAWESAVVIWRGIRGVFGLSIFGLPRPWTYGGLASALAVVVCFMTFASMGVMYHSARGKEGVFTTITSKLAAAGSPFSAEIQTKPVIPGAPLRPPAMDFNRTYIPPGTISPSRLAEIEDSRTRWSRDRNNVARSDASKPDQLTSRAPGAPADAEVALAQEQEKAKQLEGGVDKPVAAPSTTEAAEPISRSGETDEVQKAPGSLHAKAAAQPSMDANAGSPVLPPASAQGVTAQNSAAPPEAANAGSAPVKTETAPAVDNRKLIRNANLDLEVKSFQETVDKITVLTKAAGGYVDSSDSDKGGNGKLQGTVVVKVLPQNLDTFLLKLRDLGTVNNQSVSTEDVTKDYVDTQARLVNSQKMETQLQELLKRENGKVSDLLQVERELERVRGDIEQMQGQLKLYDFQVQYATVTMQIAEKDLNKTAAYLLKEQDDFSLYATDVEGTFQKSRAAADACKGEVLVATLNHNSGSDVTALLVVSVPPDQIDPFLAQIRSLGRVANFTRDTKREAKDGGDTDQPADQTLTEKDKIMVNVSIHSDDESRKQVALTVVAKAVDDALDQAKTAALSHAGVEILGSSLNKAPQGRSTAQLSVRVPGKDFPALMESFRALGRPATLSIQRNDNSGPGASGDDAPVIVSLSLTDDDTPVQETDVTVRGDDVDAESRQIKKQAGDAGVEVKASSFERSPDGTELAQMTFRLPMGKYAAFVESVKRLGKVESLSVKRDDRPDQTAIDETAPVEINLVVHNQRDIVADNEGLWPTLRQTFGEGASALFSSVRVIGVIVAFSIPWVVTILVLVWVGRRIYVWRKR